MVVHNLTSLKLFAKKMADLKITQDFMDWVNSWPLVSQMSLLWRNHFGLLSHNSLRHYLNTSSAHLAPSDKFKIEKTELIWDLTTLRRRLLNSLKFWRSRSSSWVDVSVASVLSIVSWTNDNKICNICTNTIFATSDMHLLRTEMCTDISSCCGILCGWLFCDFILYRLILKLDINSSRSAHLTRIKSVAMLFSCSFTFPPVFFIFQVSGSEWLGPHLGLLSFLQLDIIASTGPTD